MTNASVGIPPAILVEDLFLIHMRVQRPFSGSNDALTVRELSRRIPPGF
jgi:hypothetical protein